MSSAAQRLLALGQRSPLYAVGLMVGTSLDAIDAALVEIPALGQWEGLQPVGGLSLAFEQVDPDRLRQLAEGASTTAQEISALRMAVARDHERAVRELCRRHDRPVGGLAWVGAHGITLWHAPAGRGGHGWQLHAGAALAAWLGCVVVDEFRLGDIATGGQGAPLSAVADLLLRTSPDADRAVLNLGGVANLSLLPAGATRCEEIVAADIGPANLVLDGLRRHQSNGQEAFDRDGRLAATGRANRSLVSELLAQSWVRTPLPRSFGREQFGAAWLDTFLQRGAGLSAADQMRSLVELEAQAIGVFFEELAPSWRRRPNEPFTLYVTGGGRHNLSLMTAIEESLLQARVEGIEVLGISADHKEAVDFALLGGLALGGDAPDLSPLTGGRGPRTLGAIHIPTVLP